MAKESYATVLTLRAAAPYVYPDPQHPDKTVSEFLEYELADTMAAKLGVKARTRPEPMGPAHSSRLIAALRHHPQRPRNQRGTRATRGDVAALITVRAQQIVTRKDADGLNEPRGFEGDSVGVLSGTVAERLAVEENHAGRGTVSIPQRGKPARPQGATH